MPQKTLERVVSLACQFASDLKTWKQDPSHWIVSGCEEMGWNKHPAKLSSQPCPLTCKVASSVHSPAALLVRPLSGRWRGPDLFNPSVCFFGDFYILSFQSYLDWIADHFLSSFQRVIKWRFSLTCSFFIFTYACTAICSHSLGREDKKVTVRKVCPSKRVGFSIKCN